MKKLMFGMAAALALCGMAIESSNVVGYDTKDVEAGKFYIFAPQFETTEGTSDINKIVSGFTGASYAEFGEDFVKVAPQIQVPNDKGYDVYFYITDGYYEGGKEKAGWCDSAGTIAGDVEALLSGELLSGVAMWVKDVQNAESFQQAGQVPTESTVSVDAPVGFALRANPFPIAFNLNDATFTCEGLPQISYAEYGEDFVKYAAQIQVPNDKGYDVYYYITDGYYEGGKEKAGWCDSAGTIAGDAESLLSGLVPQGQGFWTKGVGSAFKMTFTK